MEAQDTKLEDLFPLRKRIPIFIEKLLSPEKGTLTIITDPKRLPIKEPGRYGGGFRLSFLV